MSEKRLICIYGIGKFGRLLYQYLETFDITVDRYIQTDPTIKEIDGIPVLTFNEVADMTDCQRIIFLAIQDGRAEREVKQKLLSLRQENISVYAYGDFIEKNLLVKHTFITGIRECNICKNQFSEYIITDVKAEIIKKHHIIGGENFSRCPYCGSNHRERWLYYVLTHYTDILQISGRLLHFAPEKSAASYIKRNPKIDYYTCDIEPGRAMHVVDITDIPYKDGSFDYIICNHVLEHIVDEKKAVSELKRVLKNEGKLLFSFPVCTDMPTYENQDILLPEERLNVYGQEDHVRLYGNDYLEHFEKYGFSIQVFSPECEMTKSEIEKYGFLPDDVIMIAKKHIFRK